MTTPADEPVTPADEEDTTVAPEAQGSDIADADAVDLEAAADDLGAGESEAYEQGFDDFDEADADYRDPDYRESDYGADAADEEAAEVPAREHAAVHADGVGERPPETITARIPPARTTVPARLPDDDEYDEYDDYEDDETYSQDPDFVPNRRGRGGYDPEADAIARAARYTFRQRAVLALTITALLAAAVAVVLSPLLWWACGFDVFVLVTYLAYLRRQVRMEEEIRRKRAARLGGRGRQRGEADFRDRHGGHAPPGGMDRDTARALRRRSRLLEPDDEDPAFEHLDPFDPARARALRSRTGGDMRRAAGE